jgi:hypothetical protein
MTGAHDPGELFYQECVAAGAIAHQVDELGL